MSSGENCRTLSAEGSKKVFSMVLSIFSTCTHTLYVSTFPEAPKLHVKPDDLGSPMGSCCDLFLDNDDIQFASQNKNMETQQSQLFASFRPIFRHHNFSVHDVNDKLNVREETCFIEKQRQNGDYSHRALKSRYTKENSTFKFQ